MTKKNQRRLAAGIMAALILIALPVGARKSLMNLSEQAQESYYIGSDGFGDLRLTMSECESYASQLYKIGKSYLDGGQEAVKALADAISASERAQLPTEKYEESLRLGETAKAFYEVLSAAGITDATDAQKAKTLSDGLEVKISGLKEATEARKATYNFAADNFNSDVLKPFPANFLAPILGVEKLELF